MQITKLQQQQRQHERRISGGSTKASDEDTMLAELFSLTKSTALGTCGAGKIEMLHYTHEIARKTAEIQQLVSLLANILRREYIHIFFTYVLPHSRT